MVIRLIAITLVLIGAAGFFMPFLVGFVSDDPERLELPLAEISDIAVSADNELFFALMFAGRIQKYSGSGEFIDSFDVDSAGGHFCLDLAGDRLTVSVARRDAADEYDLSGSLIHKNIPVDESRFETSCKFDSKIRSIGYAFDRITLSFADGAAPVIIKRKLWHYLAPGPFVSWAIFMVGLILFPEWRRGVIRMMRKRR